MKKNLGSLLMVSKECQSPKMYDEIKEILDNFEKYEARYRLCNETQFIITHREIQILLDYITNSQEEKKQLKDGWQQEVYDKDKILNDWLDLKVRNKKAKEELKKIIPICIMPNNMLIHGNRYAEAVEKTLKILEGEDKE